MDKISLAKPSITHREKEYVAQVMEEGFISNGTWVTRFEEAWAKWNHVDFGVACSNGTTAMHLALLALGIGKGDEVIVPDFTMAATAWAVMYVGATPVYVDCDDSLNIDVLKIEAKITSRTKAIMPVHIYGRQCDMKIINYIAKRHNLFVVEDMAEAHGIQPSGDIACFSFQGNKILSTGEGGMCLTDNEKWAEEMRNLSTLYFDKERSFIHERVGCNFKMTNLQAAIGLAQVERVEYILHNRKNIERIYNNQMHLAGLGKLMMPERDTLWVYDIKFDSGLFRNLVKEKLADKGIESRLFFRPMSIQPWASDRGNWYGKAYDFHQRGLYLPVYTDMPVGDIDRVVSTLKEVMVQLA